MSVVLTTVITLVRYEHRNPENWLSLRTRYISKVNSSLAIQNISFNNVIFIENQPTTLRCLARGGSPPPEMRVYLGPEDYTKYFRFDVISLISGPIGFRTLHVTSSLTSDDFRVSSEDDDKRLSCVARVPGLNQMVTSCRVTVNYAPQIKCNSVSADVGDRNVRLLCDVRTKPELTSWYWKLGANGTTISEGEVIDGYWTVVTVSIK
ncbi:hypothetical protein LSH36_718g01033 [Paralvinella palmiformis]|uniref:Ig-like domain-containing protein n=1 Tax=Paralvinella palmiformis TaxID=53620 RepID=A0AAD9J3H1_9ANNE|nr:hypothetical protein LSH36_718g01033 [Paralvinella palmiformis]